MWSFVFNSTICCHNKDEYISPSPLRWQWPIFRPHMPDESVHLQDGDFISIEGSVAGVDRAPEPLERLPTDSKVELLAAEILENTLVH